jgi:hypothetical protein
MHNLPLHFRPGGCMEGQTMRSDEYRRLYVACLGMAQQSDQPDIQSRWLKMAQAWLRLADEIRQTTTRQVNRSNVISLNRRQRAGINRVVEGGEASALSSSFVVY